MKQIILLFTLLLSTTLSFAQRTGDLTIYSNTGKKFFVVLNGVRQNADAQTNVNVSGLSNNWYSCRIIAEDKSFNIEKNVGVKMDSVVTYRITEKKGKFKLRYYSETPLGNSQPVQDQINVVYHDSEQHQNNVNTYVSGSGNGNGTGGGNRNGTGGGNRTPVSGQSTTTTTTTTTTNTSTNTQNGGISIGMDVDENGNINTHSQSGSESVNININMSENGMGTNVNIQGTENSTSTFEETTTTTTTTSSSTTINGTTTQTGHTTSGSNSTIYVDNDVTISSTGGCLTTDGDVVAIKGAIENEAFQDDKMRIANQAAKNKCMTVEQIKQIAMALDFDDDRMSFVKAAYLNCMNQSDYFQLMEIFTFSDDKEELEQFLNSK